MFDLLLEAGSPALLFHCTAGKDRTGFGAALILSALGVDRDTVLEDYLATTRLWRGAADIRKSLASVAGDVLTSVHPQFLDAGFAAMEAAHGSVEGYLEAKVGLGRARRDALRAALVE
jgi:protein-tyrosine phosphatase